MRIDFSSHPRLQSRRRLISSILGAELYDFTAHIFVCILLLHRYGDRFEWDQTKNRQNQSKHGVAFELAQLAFADPRRVIAEDLQHSESEKRYYCFGKAGGGVMTVRFTYRENVIRILGAGYWRRGKAIYERENKIHK